MKPGLMLAILFAAIAASAAFAILYVPLRGAVQAIP